MITVAIMINGNPIMARSAVNTKTVKGELCEYTLDTGETMTHARSDGAVKLAIEMLKTIKEVK